MKKKLVLITILSLLANYIFSIGFGFHTLNIRTSQEFAKGILPTSLLYQFDFPVPDLIWGQTTEIDFRLDNGLDFRSLRQDPLSGIPFAENPSNPNYAYPKDYLVLYDEMNIVLGQGFFKTIFSDKDTLKLWTTIDLRFERAFERLSYLRDSSNLEGLFQVKPKKDAKHPAVPRFENWTVQPELQGDRYTINMSMSLGFDINLMNDKITRRNGIQNSFWIRLNPQWFNAFGDETQDFILIWDKFDIAWTPFYKKMDGPRDTTWLSIVLDNSTTYRYIKGSLIPEYIQLGYIAGTRALNTEHIITNRTAITLYGPQINSYDCYPLISAFIDYGISFGQLLNTLKPITYSDTISSIGFKAEFVIFNIASVYYEIDYILDNVLNTPKNQTIIRLGFNFGV